MSELNDFGYVEKAFANIREVVEKQGDNIKAAANEVTAKNTDDGLALAFEKYVL